MNPTPRRKPDTPAQHELALNHLANGDWRAAHGIVQEMEDAIAYWLHAVVHRMEGDLDNARYWYRRARREYDASLSIAAELERIRGEMTQSG